MKGNAGLLHNNLSKSKAPQTMAISGMTIQPVDKKHNDPAHFNQ
jgi:hypothetical protein